MAPVPGANARLGQGSPGGAAGLPSGLPTPLGGLTGPPIGTIPQTPGLPNIASAPPLQHVSTLPTKMALGSAAGARQVGSGLRNVLQQQNLQENPGSTKSLDDAMAVLDQVEKGKLKPARAAKMIQGLTPGDQGKLQDLVASHFATTGTADRNVLKTLQTLQTLPAPDDVQPHDLLTNLAHDANDAVVGIPAGIGLAAVYGAKDLGNLARGKPTTHFYDKILKPVGKQYASQYGPLLHGDFGKAYERFHEHPLGPILDAASLFSAGAGTAGRLGRAGEAIDAARAGSLADAANIAKNAGKVPMRVGPKTEDAITQLWDHLENKPNFDVDHFESLLNRLGQHAHSGFNFGGPADQAAHPAGFVSQLGGIGDYAKSLAENPKDLSHINNLLDQVYHSIDTKVPLDVMKAGGGPGRTMNDDLLDILEKRYEGGIQGGHPRSDPLAVATAPDTEALLKPFAEDHPIEPTTGLSKVQLAKAGIKGFMQGGPKGNLIEAYEAKRGITHEAEIQNYMKEVASVLDNSNLRLDRRSMGQVVHDVAADIRATRTAGKARPGEMAANLPGFIAHGSTGRALSAGETALREASDLVRAGAIYLRPAYLPNNWAGNAFMNVVHQGVLAPVNLAKSLVVDKHIGKQYTAAMDKVMGATPAEVVTGGTGRGYVASLTQPVAHTMGALADQPFRRAAFIHEARRAGYRTLSDVKALFDKAASQGGDREAALRDIANIGRKAQEEIVKFGHMNEAERSVIRNLVFVYSWMRGAGRYASRFPLQHPIQTDAMQKLSGPGNDYTRSIMGGVPSFLAGSVPVGRTKDGNPILVNPFTLNPLGTGLQLARAAAGTADVVRNPKSFNKFAQEDVTGLLNPIFGSYLSAREGGQPMKKQLENTIAAMALKKGLQHPGSGGIYPTSKAEAVGHFTVGSLYPREADQQAISKALARENVGHPAAMIPQQIKDFEKATGEKIPPQLIAGYRGDLDAIQMEKDFQASYADKHGASGFRNMPPANKVDAALQYLTQHSHLPPDQLAKLKQGATQLTTDAELNDYANALWSMTGTGEYKSAWDSMMRSIKGQQMTRKR